MARRRAAKGIGWILAGLLVVWPIYQIFSSVQQHFEKKDSTQLLYQVAMFQMELLNSYMLEAPRTKDTNELTNMKQALFTAMYTHERLVLAAGDGELNALASLSSLMQYIEKLQLGGERLLRPDEQQLLSEAAKQFAQIYDGYGRVLDSGGRVISSQNEKMVKADKALKELLKKKWLQ